MDYINILNNYIWMKSTTEIQELRTMTDSKQDILQSKELTDDCVD